MKQQLTPAGKRVLEVASDLFYRYGINTVGMELVAEQAGVTKKTIYDRFGSKESLVTAYLATRDERWRSWMAERLAPITSPTERVLVTFDALGEWMASENPRGCAFINASAELYDPEHPARKVAETQKHWLREMYLDLAARSGATHEIGDALLMLHEGAVVAYNVGKIQDATRTARNAAESL